MWNTAGLYANTYDVAVFVRKSGTTTGYDGMQQKTIQLRAKCTSILLDSWPGTLLTLSGYAYCYDPQFSYVRTLADGSESWTAVGSPWVTSSIDMETSGLTPGYYDFKVEAREGTVGSRRQQ